MLCHSVTNSSSSSRGTSSWLLTTWKTQKLRYYCFNAQEDPWVKAMHERAEVFDPRAEYAFSYLQVITILWKGNYLLG